MTSTDTLRMIDQTLAETTYDDPTVSADAVRYIPLQPTGDRLPALFIPADADQPVRPIELPTSGDGVFASAYKLIGCSLIEVIEPVDGVNYLFDEEGGPAITSAAVLNERATGLAHALKFAQAVGEYTPDNDGANPHERLQHAFAWQATVRLHGNVIVVGFVSGMYRPIPQPFLDFARKALNLDVL